MKLCPKCKIVKESDKFHYDPARKNNISYHCKTCATDISSANYYKRKAADPKRIQQISAKSKYKGYGLTEENYKLLLVKQNYVCAVCFDFPRNGQELCVDHDHNCCMKKPFCGQCVRGLLCHRCNQSLGLLKENLTVIKSLGSYLEKFSMPD